MTTPADIANQALQIMGGNQPLVAGAPPTFTGPAGIDGGAAAAALNQLYLPCVQTVMRQFPWDFARKSAALALSGNPAPRLFAFEYNYPSDAIQIWELAPAVDADPNDPLPVNYVIANAVVLGTQAKVIQTDLANAWAIYNDNPNENTWSALFREAVVRLLASELSMAIAGKPDTSQALLESGSAFESLGEERRD